MKVHKFFNMELRDIKQKPSEFSSKQSTLSGAQLNY